MDLSKSDKFGPSSNYVYSAQHPPVQHSFYVRAQTASLVGSDSEEESVSSSSTSSSSSSVTSSRTCSCSSDEVVCVNDDESTWPSVVDTGFHNLPTASIRIGKRSRSTSASDRTDSCSTTCSEHSGESSTSSDSQPRGYHAPRTYSYPPAAQVCRLYPHPHPDGNEAGLGLNAGPTLSVLPMRCSSNSNSGRQTPVKNTGGERSEASEERALSPQGGPTRSPSPVSSELQATVVLRQTSVRRRPASPAYTAGQRRRLDVEWERVNDDGTPAVNATSTTAEDKEFASMNVSVSTRRTVSPTFYMNATSKSPESPDAAAATAPEGPASSGLTTRFYSGTERTLSPTAFSSPHSESAAMVEEVEERTIIIQAPVDSPPPSITAPDTPTPRAGKQISVVTDANATDREIVHSALVDIGNKKVRILSQEPLDGLTQITGFTATNEVDVDIVPLSIPDWPTSPANCETKSASIGFKERLADVRSTTEIMACDSRSPTPQPTLAGPNLMLGAGKADRDSPAPLDRGGSGLRSENDAVVRRPEVAAVALQKEAGGLEDQNVILTQTVTVNGVDASKDPPGANIMLVRKNEGFNLRIAVAVNIESEETEDEEDRRKLDDPTKMPALSDLERRADAYVKEEQIKPDRAEKPLQLQLATEQSHREEALGEVDRPESTAMVADSYIREPMTKGPPSGKDPGGGLASETKAKDADAAESFDTTTEQESEADRHKVPPGPLDLAHSQPYEENHLGVIERTDHLEQPAQPSSSPPPTERLEEGMAPEHDVADVDRQKTPEIPQQQLSERAESSLPIPQNESVQPTSLSSVDQPNAADQTAVVDAMPPVTTGSEMQYSGFTAEESSKPPPGPDEQQLEALDVEAPPPNEVASSQEAPLVPTAERGPTQPQQVKIAIQIEFTSLSPTIEDVSESSIQQATKGETPKSIEPVTTEHAAPQDDTMLMSPQKTVSAISEQAVEEVVFEEPQQAAENVSTEETHADFETEAQTEKGKEEVLTVPSMDLVTEEEKTPAPVLEVAKEEEEAESELALNAVDEAPRDDVDNEDGIVVTTNPITGEVDISVLGGAVNPEDELDIAIRSDAETGQVGVRIMEGSRTGSPATELDIVVNTESADTEQVEVDIQESVYMIPEGEVAGEGGMEIAISSNQLTGDVELQIKTLVYSAPTRESEIEEAALVMTTPFENEPVPSQSKESAQVMSESEAEIKMGMDIVLSMSSTTEEVDPGDVELLRQPTPHDALSEVDIQINETQGILQVKVSEMQVSEAKGNVIETVKSATQITAGSENSSLVEVLEEVEVADGAVHISNKVSLSSEPGQEVRVEHMTRVETAEMDLEIFEEIIETGEEVVYERVTNITTPDGGGPKIEDIVHIQSHLDDEVVLSVCTVAESGADEAMGAGPTDTTIITVGPDPGQTLTPDQLTNGPFTLELQIFGPNIGTEGQLEIVIEGTEMISPRSAVPTIAAIGGGETAVASTIVSEAATLPQTSGTLDANMGPQLISPTPDATLASGHTSPLIFRGQVSISYTAQSIEDVSGAGTAVTATALPTENYFTVQTRAQVATEIATYTDKDTGQIVVDSVKPTVAVSSNAPKTLPVANTGIIPITAQISMDATIRTGIDTGVRQAPPWPGVITKESATATDLQGSGSVSAARPNAGRVGGGGGRPSFRAPPAHRCSSLHSETTCFWKELSSRTCSMRQQQTKATNHILDSLILDTLKTLKQRQRPAPGLVSVSPQTQKQQ
ncbi:hypothetical protein AAHC03_024482 [Spirometra sp. Aus1]